MSASPLSQVDGFTAGARKLQLHLALVDGAALDDLLAILTSRSSFVDAADGRSYRVAAFDGDAKAISPELPHESFRSLDAYLELGLPADDGDVPLLDAAIGLRDEIAPLIDPGRSAAVIGDEVVIREGNGEFHGFRAIRRWPGLEPDQFAYHLLHVHTLYGRLQPGRPGYRQLIVDRPAATQAAQAAGVEISDIDAVAQMIQTRVLTYDPPPQQAGLVDATLTDGALIADRPRCFAGSAAHVVASHPPVSG
jgi:hypothetical protein